MHTNKSLVQIDRKKYQIPSGCAVMALILVAATTLANRWYVCRQGQKA
jgi:hypothetical protein